MAEAATHTQRNASTKRQRNAKREMKFNNDQVHCGTSSRLNNCLNKNNNNNHKCHCLSYVKSS